MDDLITKSAVCAIKGWTSSFFDGVPLPRYRIGKRDYFKLSDIDAAIELTKKEPVWESTKSKAPRITTSRSLSKVSGIEEARARIKSQMQKQSMQTNAEASF